MKRSDETGAAMETRVSGATLLAQMLVRWDCGPVFHVPGEGILELLDALVRSNPSVPLISCRHEGGMAYMAQAVGHVRGHPGIGLVGRAPGALNTPLALHTAWTDSAPMILIVGQPGMKQAGREAFLDDAFQRSFGPMAKWVGECTSVARLPEMLSRAWSVALTGQRGPVVLTVSEDVWREEIPCPAPLSPPAIPLPQVSAGEARRVADLLEQAEKPLLIVGGTGWSATGVAALSDFALQYGLPVMTSYRRRDLMPASHPGFVGELGIGADLAVMGAVGESDLLLVAGMRLGEINTFGGTAFEGYTLLTPPSPTQTLVHVHPDQTELNRVYQAQLPICALAETLFPVLDDALEDRGVPEWSGWRGRLRDARLSFVEGRPCPGPVDMREVCRILREELPEDAMLTVGAGSYAHWPQRYFPHERYGTQLGPKSGAMGYGLSAAIGVQAAHPDRRVVAMAGDGCFMMHGEELATAVLHRLPITVIVVNNSRYGAIAATQARHFGQTVGTELSEINFADYARAVGATGIRVTSTDGFRPAMRTAATASGPVLIELITGSEALRP